MARDLPTGVVTLLFTDVEGSTRLLHELGDDYGEALQEHRRRLRATFAEHEGKTTVMVHWSTLNATDEERRTFNAGREGMTIGWSGTFDQLTAYLAKG